MRPLQAQQNASEGHQAFTEVVEDWLLRPRNPHADEAILDAVQRRQERQDDAQRAHTTSADNETHATPSTAVVSAVQLVKLQGEQQGETWLLPSDRPVLVGRSGHKTSSLDVNLWPDMSVSRRHALIWFDGEGWYIEDLQSTNGTVLGDSDIRGPACHTSCSWDQNTVRVHHPDAHGARTGEGASVPRPVLMSHQLTEVRCLLYSSPYSTSSLCPKKLRIRSISSSLG